jgi:serine/threonine-protein kinase
VVEMSKPAAEKLIKKDGLTVGSTPTAYSATVAVGDIVRTDPGAGTSVPVGSDVTLFVSSGPAPVKVPSVVGDTESAAKSALAPLNVTITTSQQPSSQTPGTVTSQSMTGSVPAGSTINLVIAEAPPMVKVPTVTGDTAAAASKALKAAGFSVTQTSMTVTDQTEDGTVISQTPNAGRQAKKGATVTIVVGKFTAPTQTTSTPTTTTTTPTTTT